MNAVNAPIDWPYCRHANLVTAQEKGSPSRAICCLYFDQQFTPHRIVGEDIVTGSVAVFNRSPPDLLNKVGAIRGRQLSPLQLQNEFLSSLAEDTILVVAFHRVELSN